MKQESLILYSLVVFYILVNIISVQSDDIMCISCHKLSPPYRGCVDREDTNLTEAEIKGFSQSHVIYVKRGQDLVDKCKMCAIEDTWSVEKGRTVGQRRKLCLVTDAYETNTCTYHYPVGTEYVVETCRCNETLCNQGDITTIGGKFNVKLFPEAKTPVAKYASSSGNMEKIFGFEANCPSAWIWTFIIAAGTLIC